VRGVGGAAQRAPPRKSTHEGSSPLIRSSPHKGAATDCNAHRDESCAALANEAFHDYDARDGREQRFNLLDQPDNGSLASAALIELRPTVAPVTRKDPLSIWVTTLVGLEVRGRRISRELRSICFGLLKVTSFLVAVTMVSACRLIVRSPSHRSRKAVFFLNVSRRNLGTGWPVRLAQLSVCNR